MRTLPTILATVAALILPTAPVRGEFVPGYDRPGLTNFVNDLVAFDDGGGERLYATGRFRVAEDVEVGRIAAWDGTGWHGLTTPP
ncbi:MAG: hypothetical protein AAFY88_22685, partial [Acidobacteriota bacterium]